MKTITRILLAVALLLAGFAVGFPVGENVGFDTGGEWALIQADLLAREAGVFMPVYFEEGQLRVVVKQPRDMYKRAWRYAGRYSGEAENVEPGARIPSRTVSLIESPQPAY